MNLNSSQNKFFMNYELHRYIYSSSEISQLKLHFIKIKFSNPKLKKKKSLKVEKTVLERVVNHHQIFPI